MLWDVTCSVHNLDINRAKIEKQVSEIQVSQNLCSFLVVWILLYSSYTNESSFFWFGILK